MERTKIAARAIAERMADYHGVTYYVVSMGFQKFSALDEEGVENHAGHAARVLSQHQPCERPGSPRKKPKKRH